MYLPIGLIQAIRKAKEIAHKSDGTAENAYIHTHMTKSEVDQILRIIDDKFSEINFVNLDVGMTYYYADGNGYKITQMANDTVVLKRIVSNSKGEIGSTFVESKAKVERDLLSGRAKVYNVSNSLLIDYKDSGGLFNPTY